MEYEHPKIRIEMPAPGHYIIAGHDSRAVRTEDGVLAISRECHIPASVPDDALEAILRDRKGGEDDGSRETVVSAAARPKKPAKAAGKGGAK